MDYEGKEKWVTFNQWQVAFNTFSRHSYKNKRRSKSETGEAHAVFGGDSREIEDHSREDRKEPSKLPKRKDS